MRKGILGFGVKGHFIPTPQNSLVYYRSKKRRWQIIYLVIVDKITPEGKKNLRRVWEWQRQLDDWLISHGAKFESVKHFLTLIGEPTYETWLEYPNYAALDEDAEKAKEFAPDPEFQELVSQMDVFFERVSSRIVKVIE